ncbi:thrombospondin type 3 repeat-containing protein [Variovorax boronicumulans]|uniref:thrombospondin type 3 repeat-containing protein n=1 Tax=Variovorax boronicumulans TaxID=436515 RepID=UPI0033952002
MKKTLAIVLAASAVLGGCVVAPYDNNPPPRAQRDRDRDGVPNRVDRDRDGDGVPNRYDRAPNNPNR